MLLLDRNRQNGQRQPRRPCKRYVGGFGSGTEFQFTDHFMEVPYDLSKVLFVCTANATDDIPGTAVRPYGSYRTFGIYRVEKIEIANKFLLKKNMALHGIPDGAIEISNETYAKIIERYTSESGVRNLEREIATICRKVALKLVNDPAAKAVITVDNLREYLGQEKHKRRNGFNTRYGRQRSRSCLDARGRRNA